MSAVIAQDVSDLLESARRAAAAGEVEQSQRLYAAARSLASDDPRPLMGLGALALQAGRLD